MSHPGSVACRVPPQEATVHLYSAGVQLAPPAQTTHVTVPLPPQESLHVPVQAVTRLTFSSSGRQLAAATADHHVLLLSLVPWRGTQTRWEYIGRHAAHRGDVTGLVFGEAPSGQTKLFSIGEGLSTPCCASFLEVLWGWVCGEALSGQPMLYRTGAGLGSHVVCAHTGTL